MIISPLANPDRHTAAGAHIEDMIARALRHIEAHASLRRAARDLDIETAETDDYPSWRQRAERLTDTGEAILADGRTCGPRLARIGMAVSRTRWAIADITGALRRTDEALHEAAALRQEMEETERDEPDPRRLAWERARQAQEEAREYSRVQSAVRNARSPEKREAAQKAVDDHRAREAHKCEDAGEKRRRSRRMTRRMHMGP